MNITIPPQVIEPACPRPELKRHDTYSSYRHGCRCVAAREDARLYHKRRREGRQRPLLVDPTGTRRRIQALRAIGYDNVNISAHLGVTPSLVWCYANHSQVNHSTAEKITALYDQLSMTPGPSERSRQLALREGWAPPLAWDDDELDDPMARPKGAVVMRGIDELAVQLAVKGQLGARKLTRREARVAIQRMRQLGIPTGEIARRANVSERTVHRQGHAHTTTAAA